jgi:hypothetical protein
VKTFRIKFKEVNVRTEYKLDKAWRCPHGYTRVASQVDLDEWRTLVNERVAQVKKPKVCNTSEPPVVEKSQSIPERIDILHVHKEVRILERVDILPAICKTEEGQKQLQKVIDDRNTADYDCFLILQELLEEGFYKEVRIRAAEAVRLRNKINDDFLTLISGR